MAPLGTVKHIEECTIRRLKEAAGLCAENMDFGLTVCEKAIEDDGKVINEILRRSGHV